MLCSSPWKACPFLTVDGGGVDVEVGTWEGEGLEEGGETAVVCKINEKILFKKGLSEEG